MGFDMESKAMVGGRRRLKKKKTIKSTFNIKSIIITIVDQTIRFSQLNMQSIIFQCQKEKLKVLGIFSKLLVGIVSFNRSMG